ncbi:MAG: NUDIX hydrolase [Lachnospiraceae bacterium]|nr:NUDIX hydrolase [Lachnospiraceae bacterium]MDD7326212.1 NUDIX hydrolase [Lachnospiraceae bacterium]MDY2758958.1 NUDIX hydrolase [Lachnospiraceae bacterium]
MAEAIARLDEIWDIYDKDKRLTGRTMKRNDWNMADGDYHLTVLGVVQRPDGRYLITKRIGTKEWAPGAYEVPGGGVRAGETSEAAVRREVMEETGVDVLNATDGGFVFDYRRDNPEEKNNYFADVYKYTIDVKDEDIHLQADETAGYEFATADQIKELADQGQFLHYDSIKETLQ